MNDFGKFIEGMEMKFGLFSVFILPVFREVTYCSHRKLSEACGSVLLFLTIFSARAHLTILRSLAFSQRGVRSLFSVHPSCINSAWSRLQLISPKEISLNNSGSQTLRKVLHVRDKASSEAPKGLEFQYLGRESALSEIHLMSHGV